MLTPIAPWSTSAVRITQRANNFYEKLHAFIDIDYNVYVSEWINSDGFAISCAGCKANNKSIEMGDVYCFNVDLDDTPEETAMKIRLIMDGQEWSKQD